LTQTAGASKQRTKADLDAILAGATPKVDNAQLLSDMDKGTTGTRFLRGMLDPVVGLGQIVFEGLKDFTDLDERLGITSESYKQELKEMDEASARGQKALGRGTFDAARIGGNVVTGLLEAPLAPTTLLGTAALGGVIATGQPVTDEDFWTTKAQQAAVGAALGAGTNLAGKGVRAVGEKVAPYFTSSRKLAGKAIKEAVGSEYVDDIAKALRADINPLTKGSAGEVAAEVGSTRFSALSKAVDKDLLPDEMALREATQNAGRLKVVDEIADLYDPSVAARDVITTPKRVGAIAEATERGIASSPIIPKDVSGNLFLNSFDEAIDAGGGSPLTTRSLRAAKTYVKKNLVGENGAIDPEKLYQFRKEGLNEIVSRVAGKDNPSSASLTEGTAAVRQALDDVMEQASGGKWKDYLSTYAEMSVPVDQAKVCKVLKKALGDSLQENKVTPKIFTNALDDSKRTLKTAKVLKKTLGDVLDEGQMKSLGSLKADLGRAAEYQRLANAGSSVGKTAMDQDSLQLVNPLIREIMVANAGLKKLSERNQARVMKELGILFKRDPDQGYREKGATKWVTDYAENLLTGTAEEVAGIEI